MGNKEAKDMEKTRTSGLAIASLVCGICGLVIPFVGFVLSILAIVFGWVAISQTGRDPSLGGRGLAVAGLVCGIIDIALWVILIAWIGIFVFWA